MMTDPTPQPDPAEVDDQRARRFAQGRAVGAHARGDRQTERQWLDLLHLMDFDDAARTADAAARLADIENHDLYRRGFAAGMKIAALSATAPDADLCTCGMAEQERTGHDPQHADWCDFPDPAPDAGQREAQGRAEPLVEFLTGMRGYIPPAREGESFGVCDVCRDIECGGACPDALLVVRQVIEALDNEDDREYVRDEFRDQGLPLARADRSPDA